MPLTHLLKQTVKPTQEPVSVAELKEHLRIVPTDTGQDDVLARCIASARGQFEITTDRAVMLQTWRLSLPPFNYMLPLPHPPLVDPLVEFEFIDDSGDNVSMPEDSYRVEYDGCPGLVCKQADWPSDVSGTVPFPFVITYQAGAASPDDVDENIKAAILLLAAYLYTQRETAIVGQSPADMPHAFTAIVSQYRVWMP